MAEKRLIFKDPKGQRQFQSIEKFIFNELEIFNKQKDSTNILIQCSNELEYEDVLLLSKKISSSLFFNTFVREQSMRCPQLINIISNEKQQEFLYGDNDTHALNIVFVANQNEYISFVFNEETEKFLSNLNDNNANLILISPDNFNPLELGNARFIQDNEEMKKIPNYITDNFIFLNSCIYNPIKTGFNKVDLRDTVTPEMGAAFYSYSMSGLSPIQRWELVKVLDLDKKTIKSLIADGTLLQEEETKKVNLPEDVMLLDYSSRTNYLQEFKLFIQRLIAYSKTVY